MRHSERGSAAIEAVIGVPAFVLFIGLIVFAGRSATAHQAVESAAADAARAASITREARTATTKAEESARLSINNQGLDCINVDVQVDAAQFRRPPGEPATVEVTVTCRLDLSDLVFPGVPGSHLITQTVVSPIDTWRGRE